jgi:hypothetical protein
MWRTGEALHDSTLDAGWDFGANPGRYMNDPRMQVYMLYEHMRYMNNPRIIACWSPIACRCYCRVLFGTFCLFLRLLCLIFSTVLSPAIPCCCACFYG